MYSLTSRMGMTVLSLLKYREARSTVSGTYSRIRFRYTSSLCGRVNGRRRGGAGATHARAVAVVEGLELDDVGVADDSHDLQLSVLGGQRPAAGRGRSVP